MNLIELYHHHLNCLVKSGRYRNLISNTHGMSDNCNLSSIAQYNPQSRIANHSHNSSFTDDFVENSRLISSSLSNKKDTNIRYENMLMNFVEATIENQPLIEQHIIDFSSNDYLLLSKSPEVINAAIEIARKYGVGSTGSRLLSGNCPIFAELESRIAADKNTESALIFNSGFQTNFSVLSSLIDPKILGQKPLILFDRLNHSSLYQAVLHYGHNVDMVRYRHNDMDNLEELLQKYSSKNNTRIIFIVSETVFGMDGDIIDIDRIAQLSRQYNAFLYLDEAHATGMFGSEGYGISTNTNLQDINHLIMGTFSKAIGVSGGYIACSEVVRNFIINKCSGFIYSTANSPMVIGAALKSWQIIPSLSSSREQIFDVAEYARNQLKNTLSQKIDKTNTCNIPNNSSLSANTEQSIKTHIIPLIIGDDTKTIQIKEKLYKYGIVVSAVRPPTVPPGTARIRVAINAGHTYDNIDKLVEILNKCIVL